MSVDLAAFSKHVMEQMDGIEANPGNMAEGDWSVRSCVTVLEFVEKKTGQTQIRTRSPQGKGVAIAVGLCRIAEGQFSLAALENRE